MYMCLLTQYITIFKHGRKAKLPKDKCWMHIGVKLTLRYFKIHVIYYYDISEK